jgi:hypothetical protein
MNLMAGFCRHCRDLDGNCEFVQLNIKMKTDSLEVEPCGSHPLPSPVSNLAGRELEFSKIKRVDNIEAYMNHHWESLDARHFTNEAHRILKIGQEAEAKSMLRKAVIIRSFEDLSVCERKELSGCIRRKKGKLHTKYLFEVRNAWGQVQALMGTTPALPAAPIVLLPVLLVWPALLTGQLPAPAQLFRHSIRALDLSHNNALVTSY